MTDLYNNVFVLLMLVFGIANIISGVVLLNLFLNVKYESRDLDVDITTG